MDKIYVVYWSQSGNTQAMAEAVGKGITDAGKEAAVVYVGDASIEDLKNVSFYLCEHVFPELANEKIYQ